MPNFFTCCAGAALVALGSCRLTAQSLPNAPSTSLAAQEDRSTNDQQHSEVTIAGTPKRMLQDAVHIVGAPAYVRPRDLAYLLPIAAATVASLNTDTKAMTEVVSRNPSLNQTSVNISDGLRDGFIAAPAAMLLVGARRGDGKLRETGILASEAWIDAYLFGDVVKLASFRERPLADSGKGKFYVGSAGYDSSFISGHSLVAWSSAAAIAQEYKSPWVGVALYTAATGVSVTRVLGQQHFPTDVLLGSACGWLIGHYVVRAHHHADVK